MDPNQKTNIGEELKMSQDLKIDIILPTLNEEVSISSLIQNIKSHKFQNNVSVLVIDGQSTDNTVELCRKLGVEVIVQRQKGKGAAMKQAVEYSDADIIVFMDGDGTYSIEDFEKIISPIIKNQADMVVGSRTMGNSEKGSITTFNKLGNKLFNATINFGMKTKLTDSLTGYRALRKKTFEDLVLLSNGFDIEVEMTVESLSQGYRVIEVPIQYKNRKNSETKLNPFQDGTKITKTLLFVIMNIRPILFFGLFSSVFFVIGAYFGLLLLYQRYVLDSGVYTPFAILASLLLILGVLLLILGLVSELTVRSRRRIEYLIKKKFSV